MSNTTTSDARNSLNRNLANAVYLSEALNRVIDAAQASTKPVDYGHVGDAHRAVKALASALAHLSSDFDETELHTMIDRGEYVIAATHPKN